MWLFDSRCCDLTCLSWFSVCTTTGSAPASPRRCILCSLYTHARYSRADLARGLDRQSKGHADRREHWRCEGVDGPELRRIPSAFVTRELATVTATALRDAFRKRCVFRKRVDRSIVRCVSYRVNLRLSDTRSDARVVDGHAASIQSRHSTRAYEKPLLFTRTH
ncbi:hypothetical protein PybrP1_003363 [[Pythium] brassicae (nom. inval.)]|nr:hypothetical protein PybrP1_003363 [[Pythium] brassicae (nom. inval.)]